MSEPIICFGQQPCGIFPKRFLLAKIQTARRLQREIGGEIVFFLHDSDHDAREIKTLLRHRKSGEPFEISFTFDNRLQRKYSPLFLKRVRADWHAKTALQLPAFAPKPYVQAFREAPQTNVADLCLEMYRRMNLLDGIRVARSSDADFRRAAGDIADFFVDVEHQNEIVRARFSGDSFKLHEGGDSFISLPLRDFDKSQVGPTRDTRLKWMQSVIRCTHYVCGAGEQAYMNREDAPEILYVRRDDIERSDEAYIELEA